MGLLELLVVVLLILWALGLWIVPVGSMIHVLLVIVVVLVIYRLATGRRL